MKKIGIMFLVFMTITIAGCEVEYNGQNFIGNKYDTFEDYEEFLDTKEKGEIVFEKEVETDDYDSLKIGVVFESVDVYYEDRDSIKIHYYSIIDESVDPELIISETGDVVFDIEWPQKGYKVTAKIDVYLPNGSDIPIDISTVSAYIESDQFVSPRLSLDTVSGKIEAGRVFSEKVFFDTVSGGIYVDSLVAETTMIETVSGRVSIDDNESERMTISTVSGGVNIMSVELGDMYIDTVSGSVDVTFKELNTTFEYDTVSGNVSMGDDISSDFDKDKDEDIIVIGNGEYDLKVDTVSGSISVEIK